MGIVFSSNIFKGSEKDSFCQCQSRKQSGLRLLSVRFFPESERRFSSVTELVQELVNGGFISVVSTHPEFIFNMEGHNDLSDLFYGTPDTSEDEADDDYSYTDEYEMLSNTDFSEDGFDEEESDVKDTDVASSIEPSEPNLIKSREYLKAEISVRARATDKIYSVLNSLCQRELGVHVAPNCTQPGSSKSNMYCLHLPSNSGFSASKKAFLGNRFFPNRRRVVDSRRTKTFCCHYTPDGKALLTASQDEKVRIYKRRGHRLKYCLSESIASPFVGWSILDLVVSPDGRHYVYSTWNENLYQCKLDHSEPNDGNRFTAFNLNQDSEDYRFAVFSIRFNRDGSEIIGGASDGRLYLYNCEHKEPLMSVVAHEDDVNAVCFGDTNGHLFFSAGDDGICKVWDRRSLGDGDRPVGAFAGHRDGITFIDSKGDDRYILTNSKDQTIKLWDIRCFSSDAAQEQTKRSVKSQRWDYRYQLVPKKLRTSEPLENDGAVFTFRGGHSVLHTLVRAHFSPPHTGQRYIYTGCARGTCTVYDIMTGAIVAQLKGHQSVVRDCVWHPDENEIITTSWDGVTACWRFDERMERSINPEVQDGFIGDELSDYEASDY